MLEARINQLQSDVVIDVQHAKVEFVQAHSSGRGVSSGKGPKSTPQEKTDLPKSGQTAAKGGPKLQTSRWIEKLTLEKKAKLEKQQHLEQKVKKSSKEKAPVKSKSTKGSLMLPGTATKTISTTAKKTVPLKKKRKETLSDRIKAAVSSRAATTTTTSAAAASAAATQKVSKGKQKHSKGSVPDKESQKTVIDSQERPQTDVKDLEADGKANKHLPQDSEGVAWRDIQLSIRSYLEACVFARDVERGHRFLLSQHRVRSRRRLLNTDIYNIMMRVWAKKVSPARFEKSRT